MRQIGGRIEIHDQHGTAGRNALAHRETEIHGRTEPPRIGGVYQVVQRHIGVRDIVEFDELIQGVIDGIRSNQRLGGMVEDFANDNRSHQRKRVGRT